jgi:hypothetical protein
MRYKGVLCSQLDLFFPLTEHQIRAGMGMGRHQEAREICLYVLSRPKTASSEPIPPLLQVLATLPPEPMTRFQRLIMENRFIRMDYYDHNFRNLKALYNQE